jgi:hypothetical protein
MRDLFLVRSGGLIWVLIAGPATVLDRANASGMRPFIACSSLFSRRSAT